MDSNKPLVSVLMNCHDCSDFLQEAIDSVYFQTYKNWEIIFFDNASNDKSRGSILKYFGLLLFVVACKFLYEYFTI